MTFLYKIVIETESFMTCAQNHSHVKKSARKAMYLCIAMAPSNGIYLCKKVSLRNVIVFLHMVTRRLT